MLDYTGGANLTGSTTTDFATVGRVSLFVYSNSSSFFNSSFFSIETGLKIGTGEILAWSLEVGTLKTFGANET